MNTGNNQKTADINTPTGKKQRKIWARAALTAWLPYICTHIYYLIYPSEGLSAIGDGLMVAFALLLSGVLSGIFIIIAIIRKQWNIALYIAIAITLFSIFLLLCIMLLMLDAV